MSEENPAQSSTISSERLLLSSRIFRPTIPKLPQNIMVSVQGLIMSSALSSTPYEDLKGKLVCSYTLSRWQRFSQLIHHPSLRDQRPTALMDDMLALLHDGEVPGSLFLGLFLERLPVQMRDHLVAKDFKNPIEIALHADKLWDLSLIIISQT